MDDLPAVWQTTNHILKRAGKSPLTLDEFRLEFTLPFARFYENYLPGHRLEDLERWWHEFFPGVEHLVEPLSGSREFLEFAKDHGLRTFICSAIHYNQFSTQSERSGFMHLIDAPYIEISDKTERIHHILEENDLIPGETLFVGDMEHDVQAARAGKIWSCAVLTGYNGLRQLREAGPDLIVENLAELRKILTARQFVIPPASSIYTPEEEMAGTRVMEARPVSTVGALIFNDKGQVLMIQTHKWSDLWGIPGGKIRHGESATDALVREIDEETSLKVENTRFVLVQDCINSGEFYRPAHFLLLNYTALAPGHQTVRLNEEAQNFSWVDPAEALSMDLNTPTRILLEAVIGGNRSPDTVSSQMPATGSQPILQTISVNGLELFVHIGVPDWERTRPQRLLLDLEFPVDVSVAARTDDLSRTTNYASLVAEVTRFAGSGSWKLLEKFIEDLVRDLRSRHGIPSGKVRVVKHVMAQTDSISVSREWGSGEPVRIP